MTLDRFDATNGNILYVITLTPADVAKIQATGLSPTEYATVDALEKGNLTDRLKALMLILQKLAEP